MKIIRHRTNTLSELLDTDPKYGIEVDIRSAGHQLIIHHDPFARGESLDDWISGFKHGTLILNLKEEGLESAVIALMKARKIVDYFFLDQSFPYLIKWSNAGEHRCAVRVSEFESIETALALADKINWVWVDCFSRFPLSRKDSTRLKIAGFKLCLASPELHGHDPNDEIPKMISLLHQLDITVDAVCTKRPDLWEE